MNLRTLLFKGSLMLLGLVAICGESQAKQQVKEATADLKVSKKPLDHSVYDKWVGIDNYALSKDSKYATVIYKRAENDGYLQIINLDKNSTTTIDRGTKAQFTPDNKHIICMISPFFAKKKEATLKKYKDDKMPKDSLCIMNIINGKQFKFPMASRYEVPKDGGRFIAFESRIESDSLKNNGIFIYDLSTEKITDTLKNLASFFFNKQGTELYCVKKLNKKEKEKKTGIFLYNPENRVRKIIIEGGEKCSFNKPTLSKDEKTLFFYANTDTTKKFDNHVEIWTYKLGNEGWTTHPEHAIKVVDNKLKGIPEGFMVSKNRNLSISQDGRRLFFGISQIPPQKDTSKYKEEKAQLDIWHYNDPYIQTQQLKQLEKEKNKTYLSYVLLDQDGSLASTHSEKGEMIQLESTDYHGIRMVNEGDADWAYVWSRERYSRESQWDFNGKGDLWIITLKDGEAKMLLEGAIIKSLSSSPEGKFLTWYDPIQKHWFSWNQQTGAIKNITEKITVPLWKEDHDMPMLAPGYGSGNWRPGDRSLFIYDKYDIWEVDPNGIKAPQMLTQGKGRELGYTFRITRIQQADPAWNIKANQIADHENIYFTAFCNKSKGNGYYTREVKGKKLQPMKKLIMEPDFALNSPRKNAKSNTITYIKSNFEEAPNLWITKNWFKSSKKLTESNPQQQEYNWGTVESVYWKAYNGLALEGLLFKPEDFDASKKYPMVVYFYEKDSQHKHVYRRPGVSRSIINVSYFVSNGYLVFIPDIVYENGHPGKSAYNCIISGVEALCQNSWVDKENMAIQGQSWGGYQVAYLITQTDMFKCAGSGAPVSNMTSAYGGIRWTTGMVRQFQYEHTQSRIGCTLWDKGGLELYIENSPLFFVDRVKTPVLIMHNDNDGSVPWTQGIELFTALKRLGKKAWMLQYNKEAHNLTKYVNAYDYTIRLSQFMDHYLKGAPMPVWMKYGVPASKKGIDWGLELIEE